MATSCTILVVLADLEDYLASEISKQNLGGNWYVLVEIRAFTRRADFSSVELGTDYIVG
jgi:hypothetical protein